MKTNCSSSKGFSLAELIGAVIVVGILATAAVGFVSNLAEEARIKTELKNCSEFNEKINAIVSNGTDDLNWTTRSPNSVPAIVAILKDGVTIRGSNIKIGIGKGLNPSDFTNFRMDETNMVVLPPVH